MKQYVLDGFDPGCACCTYRPASSVRCRFSRQAPIQCNTGLAIFTLEIPAKDRGGPRLTADQILPAQPWLRCLSITVRNVGTYTSGDLTYEAIVRLGITEHPPTPVEVHDGWEGATGPLRSNDPQ